MNDTLRSEVRTKESKGESKSYQIWKSFKGAVAWYPSRPIVKASTWPKFRKKMMAGFLTKTQLDLTQTAAIFSLLQQPKHDNKCLTSWNPHGTHDGRGLWHTPSGNRRTSLPNSANRISGGCLGHWKMFTSPSWTYCVKEPLLQATDSWVG